LTQKHLKEAKSGLCLNLISCSLLYVDVQNIVSFISEIYLPQVRPHRKKPKNIWTISKQICCANISSV